MIPPAPVYSAFCDTSSQVRTLPLLTTGTPIPSTRVFTTERSAAPCLRRRADGWRACKARKAAPDASRLLASASVDDTGLQSRNLAETGTLRDRDRDETCVMCSAPETKVGFHLRAYQCLEREASLSFLASTLRNVPLERCLADIRGSGLYHFAHAFVRVEEKSDGPKPRTDAVTEIHDRLGTSNDLILVVATDLDHYWSRGRSTEF